MQNEKDYFGYYNVFEHNLNFEIVFQKSDDALLVYDVLDNILYFYIIDVNYILLLVCLILITFYVGSSYFDYEKLYK